MEKLLRHRDDLENLVKSLKFARTDFCLTGSAVLAVVGIRENRDIDLIVRPHIRTRLTSGLMSRHVEITQGSAFAVFGITDDQLIDDPKYHIWRGGLKFVRLEVLLAWKMTRPLQKQGHLQKDIRDISSILAYSETSNDWNWDLVPMLTPAHRASLTHRLSHALHHVKRVFSG